MEREEGLACSVISGLKSELRASTNCGVKQNKANSCCGYALQIAKLESSSERTIMSALVSLFCDKSRRTLYCVVVTVATGCRQARG